MLKFLVIYGEMDKKRGEFKLIRLLFKLNIKYRGGFNLKIGYYLSKVYNIKCLFVSYYKVLFKCILREIILIW